MRLLHASEWRMTDFISDDATPQYAILSHTWGLDEVTYHDWRKLSIFDVKLKAGYSKILACREQAVRDGLEWVWVDTCCIDKSSSAELTEAINSMFRWYTNAAVCYVVLSDVEATSDRAVLEERMAKSRWFTRGWTLQELLAPPPEKLIFYSSEWTRLGSKTDFVDIVSSVTRIDKKYLQGQDLRQASVAQKMSWAALRQTSRLEDVAYCLLGLFDINMPMIYGEGDRAFIRLQEAIMTATPDDHSLFAWGPILDEADIASMIDKSEIRQKEPPRPDSATCERELFGLLAASPKDFEHSGKIVASRRAPEFYNSSDNPAVPTKIGRDAFRLDLPMWKQKISALYHWKEPNIAQSRKLYYAALLCHFEGDPSWSSSVILPLLSNGGWTMSRPRTLCYRRREDITFLSMSKKKTVSVAPEMQMNLRSGDIIFRRRAWQSPIRDRGYTLATGSWYDWDDVIGFLSLPSSQHRYGILLRQYYKLSDNDDGGICIVFHRLSTEDQLFIEVIPVNFSGKERIERDDITWYQHNHSDQWTPMFSHSMALPSDEWHVKKSPMPDVYLHTERVSLDGSGLFVDVLDLLVGCNLDSS